MLAFYPTNAAKSGKGRHTGFFLLITPSTHWSEHPHPKVSGQKPVENEHKRWTKKHSVVESRPEKELSRPRAVCHDDRGQPKQSACNNAHRHTYVHQLNTEQVLNNVSVPVLFCQCFTVKQLGLAFNGQCPCGHWVCAARTCIVLYFKTNTNLPPWNSC